MTRYSDNIYSGYDAVTSALASRSAVTLTKTYNFAGAGNTTAVTRTGVFPPGVQNLSVQLYILQNGSATVSNKITVSAGGTNLVTVDQFGSAGGFLNGTTVTSVGRITMIASACAAPPVPSGANNGGEVPFAATFVPVSADKTGSYQLVLNYSRSDTGGMAGTTS